MSYRLIKSQYGGGSFEILMLIALVAAVWFFLVQSNTPKKVNTPKKIKESFRSSSVYTLSESVQSDILNVKERPAVDLKAPGVPYLPYPKHLGFPSESSVSGRLVSSSLTPKSVRSASDYKSKKSQKMRKSMKIRRVRKVSPRSVSPKSVSPKSVVSTPVSPKSVSPKSVVSTPVSPKSVSPKSVSPKSVSPRSVRRRSVRRRSVRRRLVSPKSVSPKSISPKSVSPKSVSPRSPRAVSPKGVKMAAKLRRSSKRSSSKRRSSKRRSSKRRSSKRSSSKKVEKFTDVNKLYSVQDSYDLKTPLTKSVCSQKCCGYYWKENMDGMFKKDDPVKWEDVGVGRKFRTSNVTCMGDGVAPPGCRCYTGDQYSLLATRGGNSSKNY